MNPFGSFIKMNPNLISAFKTVPLPYKSINEILQNNTENVAVFSDYSGFNSDMQFETYAYYIFDWELNTKLINKFKLIKEKYGISERSFQFKNRKDALKKDAYREWFEVIRSNPGLLLLLAFEKSINQVPEMKEHIRILSHEIGDMGFERKAINTILHLSNAISFLPVVTPLLTANQRVMWTSDNDAILTGKYKNILSQALKSYFIESNEYETKKYVIIDRMEDQHNQFSLEELLSVPDILAGSFAATIKKLNNDIVLDPKDEACNVMIEEFAKFEEAFDKNYNLPTPCKRAIYIFSRDSERTDITTGYKLIQFKLGL